MNGKRKWVNECPGFQFLPTTVVPYVFSQHIWNEHKVISIEIENVDYKLNTCLLHVRWPMAIVKRVVLRNANAVLLHCQDVDGAFMVCTVATCLESTYHYTLSNHWQHVYLFIMVRWFGYHHWIIVSVIGAFLYTRTAHTQMFQHFGQLEHDVVRNAYFNNLFHHLMLIRCSYQFCGIRVSPISKNPSRADDSTAHCSPAHISYIYLCVFTISIRRHVNLIKISASTSLFMNEHVDWQKAFDMLSPTRPKSIRIFTR